MKEMKEVHGRHKERQCGKHLILKDRPVASTEEVAKALAAAEKATAERKKVAAKNRKKKAVSSEEEETSSSEDDSDSSEYSETKILDCIEVIM
jgi:hypothetical protein